MENRLASYPTGELYKCPNEGELLENVLKLSSAMW